MLKEHKNTFERLFRLLDVLILTISLVIAYYLRFGQIELNVIHLPIQYLVFFSTCLMAWLYFSNRFKLYGSKRAIGFISESLDVGKTSGICFVIATIPAFFIREYPLSRLFLLYFLPIHTGSLILFRFFGRNTLKHIHLRGYNFRQVLIVGRNQRAENISKKIEKTPENGIRIIGCIDHTDNENNCNYNFNLIGNIEGLELILKKNVVDEVIITLPMKSFYSEMEQIISICEQIGVEIKIPTDLFNQKLAMSSISKYHDVQMIDFYTSPKMDWRFIIKRIMDVSISFVLLIILSPLFLAVSVLIKLTSKGPAFFVQERVGYNGRKFNCLKFRSMVENAEEIKERLAELNEMDGPAFKIENDPRLTKMGKSLRKTSIDEIPQLINVFIGDMSLVGPRPPLPDEVNKYNLMDRRRLSMRPGITCSWQVEGRNLISFEKWMELDRQYVDNWSLWLDMKILAKTIPAVLRGLGAS